MIQNSPFPLGTKRKEATREEAVKPKAPAPKRVRKAPKKGCPVTQVKLVKGELQDEFLEELNRNLAEGWEVINIFVKHYDWVAALKKVV